jgi:nucleoside-diphosphate-sugar epimerase
MSHLNLNGKTAVVTGASGYIGSVLVDALLKHSCKVVRVSRSNLVSSEQTKTIKADVRNADTWAEIVAQADIIYHLAGNTSVYEAAENPADSLISTLLPLTHLVKEAQAQQCKPRVVFASTATVYGLTPERPVAETAEPMPITVYDLHKMFAEQQLALATQQGVIESVSLRLANVYGPSSSDSFAGDRGILNKVTAVALRGKNLTVYGDGKYLRDYIYISDVINAFLLAGATPNLGEQTFNVASGIGTTVKQAFELVAAEAGKSVGRRVETNCAEWPTDVSSIELRSFIADIKKFTNVTGWKPTINLRDGIALLVTEFTRRGYKHDE